MDRVAVFVDAGYLFAQGSKEMCGRKLLRGEISLDHQALIRALKDFAENISKLPLLRIYWYDGTSQGPTSQHNTLADQADMKVRLGFVNSAGQQKGVDSLIVTDMILLARNRAMADCVLLFLHGLHRSLRRRPSARRVPSPRIRNRGSLLPPGFVRQCNGVIRLLAPSLLPGDVQMDVRVTPVLQRRSRFDGPPALRGVPDLHDGPPVELPGRLTAAPPLAGPLGQFIDRRVVHPIDRNRPDLFAFQEDI